MIARNAVKSRLMLVDDHPLVRRGLAELINQEPNLEICGEAEDLTAAFQRCRTLQPDLVILDISLKDGHGLELIKQLRQFETGIRVLVFSMHEDSLFAQRAISAGAAGYVNKKEDSSTLLRAINRVLEGRIYLNAELSEQILERTLSPVAASPMQAIQSLTDRELEVFELLGQGLSTQQIATKLFLSHKTIETYREHIKRKLNITNASGLTRAAVVWMLEKQWVTNPAMPESNFITTA